MNTPTILTLPGWQNSGPDHWQTLWDVEHGHQRVEQHDWLKPLRGDWITRLEDVVSSTTGPLVLVAHSLGCVLVAAWAQQSRHVHRVQGALLVAPGDVEQEALRPMLLSWSPIPMQPLPFKSVLVASQNDPFCRFERATALAHAWGATLVDAGAAGHLNADSNLGQWPQGLALLRGLARPHSHPLAHP